MDDEASRLLSPMAFNTWLGLPDPLEQALPEETATPRRVERTFAEGDFGKQRLLVWGSR